MRRQTERLMNLLIALRSTQGWVDRDALRRSIPDYAGLDDPAFDRQFSRDKAALEEIGIAISTTAWDDPFTDGTGYGYRIDDAGYALTLEFTPEESAVVSVTQTLLADTALAPDARSALNKLRGLGTGFDAAAADAVEQTPDSPLAAVPAHVAGSVFAQMLRAVEARRAVTFEYRRPGAEPARRSLEPYGLLTRGDRSYVIGRDVDRDAIRTFRLSRVRGRVTSSPRRKDGDFSVPDGFDASAHARLDHAGIADVDLTPERRDADACDVVLAVAPGRAHPLREAAHEEPSPVPVEAPSVPAGWDVIGVRTASPTALAERLLDFSPSVMVLAPDFVAQAHVDLLRSTASALATIAPAEGDTDD